MYIVSPLRSDITSLMAATRRSGVKTWRGYTRDRKYTQRMLGAAAVVFYNSTFRSIRMTANSVSNGGIFRINGRRKPLFF
jgi:hypothetical protein